MKNLRKTSQQSLTIHSCQQSLKRHGMTSWTDTTYRMTPSFWAYGKREQHGYLHTGRRYSAPEWHQHREAKAWIISWKKVSWKKHKCFTYCHTGQWMQTEEAPAWGCRDNSFNGKSNSYIIKPCSSYLLIAAAVVLKNKNRALGQLIHYSAIYKLQKLYRQWQFLFHVKGCQETSH